MEAKNAKAFSDRLPAPEAEPAPAAEPVDQLATLRPKPRPRQSPRRRAGRA